MADLSRIDPEMQAARLLLEAETAKFPPVVPKMPIDPQRPVNDHLSMFFGAVLLVAALLAVRL